MPMIPVVENPRRRRRKRYTAKQRAAGFGGKRRRTRRRNPALAALTNPRRRRYYSKPRRRSYRRRSRNPKLLGMLNFQAGAWTAAGMIGTKVVPMMIQKVWPGMPTAGPMGYLSKIASAIVIGYGVKMGTRSTVNAQHAVNGAVALLLYDAFNEFVAPRIGLGGLGAFVSTDELAQVTGELSGFVPAPTTLGRYGDVSQDILAA